MTCCNNIFGFVKEAFESPAIKRPQSTTSKGRSSMASCRGAQAGLQRDSRLNPALPPHEGLHWSMPQNSMGKRGAEGLVPGSGGWAGTTRTDSELQGSELSAGSGKQQPPPRPHLSSLRMEEPSAGEDGTRAQPGFPHPPTPSSNKQRRGPAGEESRDSEAPVRLVGLYCSVTQSMTARGGRGAVGISPNPRLHPRQGCRPLGAPGTGCWPACPAWLP